MASFYWKSSMTPDGFYPEHDLFIQLMKLKNTLRYTKGDELIAHLGRSTTAEREETPGRQERQDLK